MVRQRKAALPGGAAGSRAPCRRGRNCGQLPARGELPFGASALGNRLSFFSGRARAPALTAAAASGKGAGFHNVSFLPQSGCPAGRANSLKNPKIGYFKAGGSPGMQRITSLSGLPGEHRAAPAINPAEPGRGGWGGVCEWLRAFPFSLTTPQKTPNLSPPGPCRLAVAKIGSHTPALLSECIGHLDDFHFIFLKCLHPAVLICFFGFAINIK